MRCRGIAAGLLLTGLILCSTLPVWGLVRAVGLETLTSSAEMVIIGRVEGIRSFWSEDRSLIMTEALILVERAIKGLAVKELRVVVGGGRLLEEDIGLWVPDEPSFQAGEAVLLFLERLPEGDYGVTGHILGKFELTQEMDGIWMASNPRWSPRPLVGLLSHLEGLVSRP